MPCTHIKRLTPMHPPSSSVFFRATSKGRVKSVMSNGSQFVLITSREMFVIHIKYIIDIAGVPVFIPDGSKRLK